MTDIESIPINYRIWLCSQLIPTTKLIKKKMTKSNTCLSAVVEGQHIGKFSNIILDLLHLLAIPYYCFHALFFIIQNDFWLFWSFVFILRDKNHVPIEKYFILFFFRSQSVLSICWCWPVRDAYMAGVITPAVRVIQGTHLQLYTHLPTLICHVERLPEIFRWLSHVMLHNGFRLYVDKWQVKIIVNLVC